MSIYQPTQADLDEMVADLNEAVENENYTVSEVDEIMASICEAAEFVGYKNPQFGSDIETGEFILIEGK